MEDRFSVKRSELKSAKLTKVGESNGGLIAIKKFLAIQGHLNTEDFGGDLDSSTSIALSKFQHMNGLAVTGEVDESTLAVISSPRCGQRDHSLSLSQECRWTESLLKYSFENVTQDMPETFAKEAIKRAFQTWSDVCQISFVEVAEDETHDISIAWRPARDSDYDLVGTDVAHADYPGDCSEVNPGGVKPIHFDADECRWVDNPDWVLDNTQEIPDFDLETVALHEIGHILGLKHSFNPNAVLYGNVPALARRELSDEDVMRVLHLYALA